MERVDKPKVFISYAWSSEEYKPKVLSFADQLLHDGVDVLLDRYLAPGIDLTVQGVRRRTDGRYAESARARSRVHQ